MELNDIFPSKSLAAADLQGRDVVLTITEVRQVEFDDGPKLEIHFGGTEKTLICNKTNAQTIAGIHGTNTDAWVGKQITLFPTQTDYAGKQVPCIRVRLQNAKTAPLGGPATDADAVDSNEVPF